MKGEDIFKALENTDEKLLAKCESYQKPKIRSTTKWVAAAAAACICVGAGAFGAYMHHLNSLKFDDSTMGSSANSSSADYNGSADSKAAIGKAEISAEADSGSDAITSGNNVEDLPPDSGENSVSQLDGDNELESDIAIEKKWEDMTVTERYCLFSYLGDDHYVNGGIISDRTKIGDKISDVTIEGFDSYNPDEKHSITAEMYQIYGISDSAFCAVKYEGYDDYYVCVNSSYAPENLQQLITDLNLSNEIEFGQAYSNYFADDEYHSLEYDVEDTSQIWDLLFANSAECENLNDTVEVYSDMDISVSVPLLGINNRGLWVSDDGYMRTNIIDTCVTFKIGEDKVQAFKDYIIANSTVHDNVSGVCDSGSAGSSEEGSAEGSEIIEYEIAE